MKANNNHKMVWTIGHSTRDLSEFIDMLLSFKIELVADIRSYPGSRKFPPFSKEALEISLPENKIQYIRLKELGERLRVYRHWNTAENTIRKP
jgi:uncharacterized protein (DUF488 family)